MGNNKGRRRGEKHTHGLPDSCPEAGKVTFHRRASPVPVKPWLVTRDKTKMTGRRGVGSDASAAFYSEGSCEGKRWAPSRTVMDRVSRITPITACSSSSS